MRDPATGTLTLPYEGQALSLRFTTYTASLIDFHARKEFQSAWTDLTDYQLVPLFIQCGLQAANKLNGGKTRTFEFHEACDLMETLEPEQLDEIIIAAKEGLGFFFEKRGYPAQTAWLLFLPMLTLKRAEQIARQIGMDSPDTSSESSVSDGTPSTP